MESALAMREHHDHLHLTSTLIQYILKIQSLKNVRLQRPLNVAKAAVTIATFKEYIDRYGVHPPYIFKIIPQ